ncbi:hypothetical protein E1176_07815 [Fulvivirga sp. RKSG066]|uniref:FISUMP domain-containing protein n=1 Tax=Fulvivirga aurantia TaxID=2529383 RepID=UPI0012BC2EB3|nr:FISUMP domain-containing protein [Fulvivirga aurantia]MTI20924.1 hypothetical protein [Fulvivirga aurantia]
MKNFKPTAMLQASLSFFALVFISAVFIGCGSDDGGDDPQPDVCAGVTISFDLEQTSCDEITVQNITGGEGAYEFSIDGTTFQSAAEFSGVASGANTITARDANGCEATKSITIAEELSLTATADAYTITVEAAGGVGPFQYSIDNKTTFQTETTFEVEEEKDYTIVVKDENGCEATVTVTADEVTTTTDSRDGQTYKVVKIGTQIWFAENFNLDTNTSDSTSSYYYENDKDTYEEQYGRLYTWYVAKEIAPEGWELPSVEQWEALENFVGTDPATKLKVGGTSGFEAKAAGIRGVATGEFNNAGKRGYFWLAPESDVAPGEAYLVYIDVETDVIIDGDTDKLNNLSVRFIKK